MTDKHTQGTIRYEYEPGYCGELIASNGNTIATFNEEPGKANARRLVACWNALIDLPQAALDGGWTRAGLESYGLKVERERDELLEVLKIAVRQNSHDMLMTGEELRQCSAAIAKVEASK